MRGISADRRAANTLKTTKGEKLTRGSEALRQGWQGLLSTNKGDERCRRYYGLAAFSERSAASFYNCFHSFQYSVLEHSKARSSLKAHWYLLFLSSISFIQNNFSFNVLKKSHVRKLYFKNLGYNSLIILYDSFEKTGGNFGW